MGVAAQAARLSRKPRSSGPKGLSPARGPSPRKAIARPALRTGHTSAKPASASARSPGPGANGPSGSPATARSSGAPPAGPRAARRT